MSAFSRLGDDTRRDLTLAAVTLALFGAVAFASPGFATPASLAALVDDIAILAMLALGQMLVILVRGIDLSVAANLALAGMLAALFNRAYPEAGVAPAIAIAVIAGAAAGAANGLLIWKLKLPPIVVTLGTMSIYRGVIFPLSHGAWVNENEMSRGFIAFTRGQFAGLTMLAWLAIAIALVFLLAMRYSRAARAFHAAGGNPDAAAYSGIDVGRIQFFAFTICGAIAGLCGYLWAARFAVAYTDIALGFELQVIAACLIGGVAIAGGVGSVAGVLLGCLFLGIIRNSLPLVGISAFWQLFINGIVIVIAVLMSARQRVHTRAILEKRAA